MGLIACELSGLQVKPSVKTFIFTSLVYIYKFGQHILRSWWRPSLVRVCWVSFGAEYKKSKNLRWEASVCSKERLSPSAYASQSPTKN